MKDARAFFDTFTVESSTLHELVEVLQYGYLFGSRCFAVMLRHRRELA